MYSVAEQQKSLLSSNKDIVETMSNKSSVIDTSTNFSASKTAFTEWLRAVGNVAGAIKHVSEFNSKPAEAPAPAPPPAVPVDTPGIVQKAINTVCALTNIFGMLGWVGKGVNQILPVQNAPSIGVLAYKLLTNFFSGFSMGWAACEWKMGATGKGFVRTCPQQNTEISAWGIGNKTLLNDCSAKKKKMRTLLTNTTRQLAKTKQAKALCDSNLEIAKSYVKELNLSLTSKSVVKDNNDINYHSLMVTCNNQIIEKSVALSKCEGEASVLKTMCTAQQQSALVSSQFYKQDSPPVYNTYPNTDRTAMGQYVTTTRCQYGDKVLHSQQHNGFTYGQVGCYDAFDALGHASIGIGLYSFGFFSGIVSYLLYGCCRK